MAHGLTLPEISQTELPNILPMKGGVSDPAGKVKTRIKRYGHITSLARFAEPETRIPEAKPTVLADPVNRASKATLSGPITGLLVSTMALRTATRGRGPGRHQIAAWLGIEVETVLDLAAQAGIAAPPDRRLIHYKNPRFLSVEARSALICDYVSDREINEISQGVGKTRQQLHRIYAAMGLGVGRGEKTRMAFRAEITRLRDRQPESVVEPQVPTPVPAPEPSQTPNPICQKPVIGRPKKLRPVSPAYTARRVETLIRDFVGKAGEFLSAPLKLRLADRCRTAYAASQGEQVISKPARGMSDEFLEVLSVYYIAGVSPGAVCSIFGLSRSLVLRIFSNFLFRQGSGVGRGNRAAWPGRLADGFDLAKISEGHGAITLVFRPCISSQSIFLVRRCDRTQIHISPYYAARLHAC